MMTILVAGLSRGAKAWLGLCTTTEGQHVLVVTVKFFGSNCFSTGALRLL